MADWLNGDDNVLTQRLASVLESRRQEVGISQEELARRAGISESNLVSPGYTAIALGFVYLSRSKRSKRVMVSVD